MAWKDRACRFGQSQLVANVESAITRALEELSEHVGGNTAELAKRLSMSQWTLRKILHQYRVMAPQHGGVRNTRFKLTPELIDEIRRDGVPGLSWRLGIPQETIRRHLRKYVREQQEKGLPV